MNITIDNTYKGPFENVGFSDGAAVFESVQKAESVETANLHLLDLGVQAASPRQNDLEVNTVSWSLDQNGHISGTAKFLAVATHDLIKATLDGHSPEPPVGQDYRVANVKVTFLGGTGVYANASGTAQVVAKLYNNGLSVGHIVGTISIP